MVETTEVVATFQMAELVWRNVSFEAPISRTDRKSIAAKNKLSGSDSKPLTHKGILEGVSGRLPSGSLTAIMGASGVGKTMLLNYLSNRTFYLKGVKYTGEVLLNGHKRSEIDFNRYVAYVMQDDVLLGSMTVRELLVFTANLRLPPEKAKTRVMEVSQQLGLESILDSQIGGILKRGISGGERRRVTIATEILNDPLVLFLDEPTTGLDSHSAENVVSLLRSLSDAGMTVCFTVHQPNSYIFSMFHSLLVLANKRVVYFGEAKNSMTYFTEVGFPPLPYANPAEHIINVLSNRSSAECFPSISDDLPVVEGESPDISANHHASLLQEVRYLTIRSFRNYIRNVMLIKFKIFAKLPFILVFFACFWQCGGEDTEKSAGNSLGFISFILTASAFDGICTIGAYFDEKSQYVREQANRTYSPLSYYIGKFVSEIPCDILAIAFYVSAIYPGVGLSFQTVHQFFIYNLLNIIVLVNAKGWCNIAIFVFQDLTAAVAFMPFVIVEQLLFAGFFINYDSIPAYLCEFEFTSILKYTWSAAVINEFETFDKGACGFSPLCDPVLFNKIRLGLWENVGAGIGLTIMVHLVALLAICRFSKAFRS